MMAKLFVSSSCLVLPQINNAQKNNVISRHVSASVLPPKRRRPRISIGNRTSSFSTSVGEIENAQSMAPVPTSVPVRVAHELLQAGHHYLDVRTPEEFGGGHAAGAVNVPYMFNVGSGMTKNPQFLEQVASHFHKHDEIIVGCQAGKRSLMAATDLLAAGFTGVTDIAGGYAAWTQNGLPTES